MSPTGIEIPSLTPGSTEWLRTMSASKVGAVMGTSPYDSPFSLWHRMAGDLGQQEQTAVMSRGHYLEPGILAWFADQHPDFLTVKGGCWSHWNNELWTASPDGITHRIDSDDWSVLEVKTAADDLGWGRAGTDEVPPGYRDQCLWQMLVVGVERCHVAVLLPFLEFREYVIDWHDERIGEIVHAVELFMDSLHTGQQPPLDDHAATYVALRGMHPEIDPIDVALDLDTAREFCQAKAMSKYAKSREQGAVNAVADAMGTARRALYAGDVIATRTSRGDGVPYVKAAASLPDFLEVSA